MISFKSGNIFESEALALVNPVNCVGVMGAGLAEKFKDRFPFNYTLYRDFCKEKKLKPGGIFHTKGRDPDGNDRVIINLATKEHFQGFSHIDWIDKGMWRLKDTILNLKIPSIAIPALGCGHGGLDWFTVKPYIVDWMSYPELDKCHIEIYEPAIL